MGVAPEPFQGSVLGLRFEMWVPAVMQQAILSGAGSLDQRGSHWLEGWARLKPGVSPARAEAELTAISAQLSREFDQSDQFPRALTTPVWKEGGGRMLAPVMFLLMTVVGVVLLIACANLSNLLLARAAGRSREIAIRLALGVSRGRLIRMLLIENGLIAMLGCAAAFAVVPAASGLLGNFTPVTRPSGQPGRTARRRRLSVRTGRIGAGDAALRTAAGAARIASPNCGDPQGRQRRFGGQPPHLAAQLAGGGAGVALAGAADRRRTAAQEPGPGARRRPRLRCPQRIWSPASTFFPTATTWRAAGSPYGR